MKEQEDFFKKLSDHVYWVHPQRHSRTYLSQLVMLQFLNSEPVGFVMAWYKPTGLWLITKKESDLFSLVHHKVSEVE